MLATQSKTRLFVGLLLAVATFALYSPAIGHPFLLEADDYCYVTHNQHIQTGSFWNMLAWAATSYDCANWHPLTWLSHSLDFRFFALNPHGHHFTSVLFHVLNVLVLFVLLAKATGAVGRSAVAAGLFAVHPLNVESVVWVAERKTVLSIFLFLIALGAYGWYARRPSVRRYILLVMLFVLALAAKPLVITFPCVLLLLDFWPLQRIRGLSDVSKQRLTGGADKPAGDPRPRSPSPVFAVSPVPLSRLVAEKVPLFALSCASAVVTVLAQSSYGATHGVPFRLRLENAIYSYAMYVRKAFWPARLALFYPHFCGSLAGWKLVGATLLLLVVSGCALQGRKSRPYLTTGWLWFLGTLVPMIGVIQVGWQAMADRYAYLPLIGVFAMVAWAAADWLESRRVSLWKRMGAAAIVLLGLALLTSRQIQYWRSSYDLWSHEVNVTEENGVSEEGLGFALVASGRTEEGLAHLRKATRITFFYYPLRWKLATVLARSGHTDEAIAEYETVIPQVSDASRLGRLHQELGQLYRDKGNYPKAEANYQQAARIDAHELSPKDGTATFEWQESYLCDASGEGHFQLGQLFRQVHRIPEARDAYQQALKINPRLTQARQALEALGEGNQ
jgi:protein O-mannosyl-transferase